MKNIYKILALACSVVLGGTIAAMDRTYDTFEELLNGVEEAFLDQDRQGFILIDHNVGSQFDSAKQEILYEPSLTAKLQLLSKLNTTFKIGFNADVINNFKPKNMPATKNQHVSQPTSTGTNVSSPANQTAIIPESAQTFFKSPLFITGVALCAVMVAYNYWAKKANYDDKELD